MMMKRLLHCILILMVLVTAGCELFSSSESSATKNVNVQPSPRLENKIDFKKAAEDVRLAQEKLKSQSNTRPPSTVRLVKEQIDDAIKELNKDQIARCTDCTEDTKTRATNVRETLNDQWKKLDPQKDLSKEDKANLDEVLAAQAGELDELSNAKPAETATNNTTPTPLDNKNKNTDDTGWWSTLVLGVEILAGVLALVLLVTALNYLWNRAWRTVELNISKVLKAHLAAAREAQPDYAAKFASLSSAQAEMGSNLTELNTEVRSLARIVRESMVTRRSDGNSSYGGFNYQSRVEDVAPKDEPEFPVSAVDYLGKMNRFANVVRPDFQNGILVNDPDGDGELVLIRDSRDDTQPFFVVPRATQFQTKQDFYTYYQKYYDCVRPMAGDVWIIGPAVVEKVAGGWQLREKGLLEIR